jgi:hypothetical protein
VTNSVGRCCLQVALPPTPKLPFRVPCEGRGIQRNPLSV